MVALDYPEEHIEGNITARTAMDVAIDFESRLNTLNFGKRL